MAVTREGGALCAIVEAGNGGVVVRDAVEGSTVDAVSGVRRDGALGEDGALESDGRSAGEEGCVTPRVVRT